MVYTGKIPSLRVVKTNQQVIDDAVNWAIQISKYNSFHYGAGEHSHHNGCYFCDTQPKSKKNAGIKEWERTYCCNPFIGAAWAHGGLDPTLLRLCRHGGSLDFHEGQGYDTSKLFDKLGKPAKSKLKKGDVLCGDSHVALYTGDGKVVQAGHQDDNEPGSKSWNSSISVGTWNGWKRAYRYNGSINVDIPLYPGEMSERVKDLQAFLVWKGYDIAIDGIFFNATKEALKDFQNKEGLTADGIAGAQTIKAIEKYASAVYYLPTVQEIRTASNAGQHKRISMQADRTASDKNIHYVRWKANDSKTHECPYCKKHSIGKYWGGNCIWGGFHTWRHGANIPVRCSCHTISDEIGTQMLAAKTDAEAKKLAAKHIGISDIEVIRNRNGIPASEIKKGDVGLLFRGSKFYHVILCQGGSKYADCTSGRKDQYKSQMNMSATTKKNLKVLIRYTGGLSYLQKCDEGRAVELIQTWLNGHGYDCGKADGIFGDKTDRAVKAFQADAGLVPDGLCGTKTINEMRARQ